MREDIFRAKAHLVFHWCLYNSGCYFIIIILYSELLITNPEMEDQEVIPINT